MRGHSSRAVREEVAYLAYHLHWPLSELLSLDHRERRRWVEEVAGLVRRAGEGGA